MWRGGNCGPSHSIPPCPCTAIQGHHWWIDGTQKHCSVNTTSSGCYTRRKKGCDHQGPADHGTVVELCCIIPSNSTHVHLHVQVDVDKPLGLSLAQSTAAGGGILVKNASGNAKKAGIESGDTIIYCSSYFGDELWYVVGRVWWDVVGCGGMWWDVVGCGGKEGEMCVFHAKACT